MKIVISPAKKMLKLDDFIKDSSNPMFENKANEIVSLIQKMNISEIKEAFKCSDLIAQNVYNIYKTYGKDKYKAIFLYNGLQYNNIDILSLDKSNIDFLNENLLIIDALYGFIKPYDLISEYRLDYKTKLDYIPKKYYKEKAKEIFTDTIINLASKEYSEILPQDKLFTINFLQTINNKTKSYSTATKIARGKFINYIAKYKSLDINTLKSFNLDDYRLIDENEKGLTFKKS